MSAALFRLDKRVAVVTGASRGIGRAIALGLAAAGADVVVASRKLPDLELLREIVAETGGSLNPSIDEITARHGARRVMHHRLDWLLVPLALALLIGDIALRMRLGGGV